MQLNGRRLDCNPYLSGGFEAKVQLEKLRARKQQLHELTSGYNGGIYNGPQFVRNYVKDPRYGVPFLSSSSMLLADLSTVPLLKRKDAQSSKLMHLRLEEGMTLISCSGTIGRMVYTRADMAGMWSSQDVMKVVPDTSKIPSGYLYGYLSSKFGVPMINAGTYGAVIQHIEPHQIAELPVPRLGESFERQVDDLIQQAARKRIAAAKSLEEAKSSFDWLNGPDHHRVSERNTNVVSSKAIQSRFDATFYNPIADQIERNIKSRPHTTLGEMCRRVFLPGIFKRILTEDSDFGSPYFSGAALYWLEPIPKNRLSEKSTLFKEVLLEEGTILVQAFGQEGGLIGRPAWVGRHLAGATTTHMLVRLNAREAEMSGYLYAYISSEAGHRLISKFPYGGSIPHLDEKGISSVLVPLMERREMYALSEKVLTALYARDDALDLELRARGMIEEVIMQG